MGKIFASMEETLGRTPLVRLSRLEGAAGCGARILAKVEGFNPGGSTKDRAAASMLDAAEEAGLLAPGGTVVEPTSGNTGIGLAAVAACRGYRAIIVMPDTMSPERINLMRAYGAQVVLTPGGLGMAGAVEKAKALVAEIPGSFIPNQFENPANAQAHFRTTGPEIWEDTQGQVDMFIAGVGTGGTVTGVGRFLKAKNPAIRVIGVEPAESPLLSQGVAGPHGIQGIGANFIPGVLDQSILDDIFPVNLAQAQAAARLLARKEGFLAGISSGAALHAAIELGKRPENAGKTLCVLLPDSGERYLSTQLFFD